VEFTSCGQDFETKANHGYANGSTNIGKSATDTLELIIQAFGGKKT
jgi:hypothetical protein